MVNRFRVLIANQPKLRRQLPVEMLKEESWIEIVGEATQESEIRELVQKTAPDLEAVTADRPGSRPAICDALLSEFYSWHCALSQPHRLKIMPFPVGHRSKFMPTKSNHRHADFMAQ